MKTTKYIIEAAQLERSSGTHKISSYEPLECEAPKLQWLHTFSDLEEALAAFEKIKSMPTTVAISLIEWQCEGVSALVTGNYGFLHCSPNAMIKRVVAFCERPFKELKYSSLGRYHEVVIGDWINEACNITDYYVGGGNWLKWTPKKLTDIA